MIRKRLGARGVGVFALGIIAGMVQLAAATETMQLSSRGAAAPRTEARSATRAIDLLRELEKRYGNVETVKGRFVQITTDPTFGEKIESKGVFSLKKPNRLRVDYDPPYASTTLVADGYSYRYVPQLKQVERYRIDDANSIAQTNYMLLGFGAHTEEVLRTYRAEPLAAEKVAAGHVGLRLVPRRPEEAAFRSIEIEIDGESKIPVEFRVVQLDGTQVSARLDPRELQLGIRLDDKLFKPAFPPNAQIVDIR